MRECSSDVQSNKPPRQQVTNNRLMAAADDAASEDASHRRGRTANFTDDDLSDNADDKT